MKHNTDLACVNCHLFCERTRTRNHEFYATSLCLQFCCSGNEVKRTFKRDEFAGEEQNCGRRRNSQPGSERGASVWHGAGCKPFIVNTVWREKETRTWETIMLVIGTRSL